MGYSAKNVEAGLLFSVQAKHATLTQIKVSYFKLKVMIKGMTVLAFSDRPKRLAFKMKFSDYHKMVHSGKDSFDETEPNMVLSFGLSGRPALPFEIKSYVKEKDAVTYFLRLLTKEKSVKNFRTYVGPVSMYIDS